MNLLFSVDDKQNDSYIKFKSFLVLKGYMNPAERQQQILREIDQIEDDLIPHLSQKYGVSEMTIRRDLKALEETGHIIRTRGGAVRWRPPKSDLMASEWRDRQQKAHRRKAAIARYAARQLVNEGDIIALEGGTTVTAMAEYLAHHENLTVVTNGHFTTSALMHWLPPTNNIICTGGILQPQTGTFVGPVTRRFLQDFHGRRTFLSARGLSLEAGFTDPQMVEIEVKQQMAAAVSEVIMLIDSSKFGVNSLMTVLPLDQITTLVTDSQAPGDMLDALRARGVEVIIAPDSR